MIKLREFVRLHSTNCTGHRVEALPWPPLSPTLANSIATHSRFANVNVCEHAMENDLTHATW